MKNNQRPVLRPFFLVFISLIIFQHLDNPLGTAFSSASDTLVVIYYRAAIWWLLCLAIAGWTALVLRLVQTTEVHLLQRAIIGCASFGLWALLISIFTIGPSKYGDSWTLMVVPVVVVVALSPVLAWVLEVLNGQIMRASERAGPRAASLLGMGVIVVATLLWFKLTDRYPRSYFSVHILSAGALLGGAMWLSQRTLQPVRRASKWPLVVGVGMTLLAVGCFSRRPALAEMQLLQTDLLVRMTLAKSWTLADSDGDGYGRETLFLAGRDCDDSNPNIHPLATEIPGNDVDENCFNGPLEAIPEELTAGVHPQHPTPAAEKAPAPYNLLWLSVDALRYFPEFPRGIHADAAPVLAKRAADAISFANYRSCASYTTSSVRMMHTGRPAGLLPIGTRGSFDVSMLLRKKGYHNSLVSTHWIGEHPGEAYDRFSHPSTDDEVTQEVADQVDNLPEPFYLFTHLMRLHFPHPAVGDCKPGDSPMARYLCLVAEVDAELETIRQALKDSGRLERTVIVISSDHGEELGEHGGQGHGDILCEHVRHVPLLIFVPGMAGAERTAATNCFDLLASVLDALNYPPLPDTLGVSHFRATGPPSVQWAMVDYPVPPIGDNVNFVSLRALNMDGWKVTLDQNTSHVTFHNLLEDPEEQHPLNHAAPANHDKLLTYMDAWLAVTNVLATD